MNNAELIVATLRAAGVSHGFGIPSGNVLPLLEAMRVGRLPYVLTAHEGSAAFAADVMGRLTGTPGLCIATLGPGATNLTTGVGNAWLDRSPLLALTCNLPTAQLGRRIQMAIDHHTLFKPITKASLALREGRVASVMAEAIELALSEPQGPVHLDLPEDVALAPATEAAPALRPGRRLAAASDAFVLFLFDAHLYASNAKLLREVQSRARALAVVLMRDPYDAAMLAPGVLGVTAYGFRKCQLDAVIARLVQG